MEFNFNQFMKDMLGSDTDALLTTLTVSYGEMEDKHALRDFTNRNTYFDTPVEAIEYFLNEFRHEFSLSGDYVGNGCFTHIIYQEGYFVVNAPELDCEYVFLYKKNPNDLVIHTFQKLDGKWEFTTPIEVSLYDSNLSIRVLPIFTTTPDGAGQRYAIPDTEKYANLLQDNILLFCFISNQCYAHSG